MKKIDILKRNKKISKTLERKKRIKTFEEISISQTISIFGGLIAGSILLVYIDHILLVPGLFILLPGFLEMGNAISGSLSSRISSRLHQNTLTNLIILKNIIASLLLNILTSVVLGAVIYTISRIIFKIDNYQLFIIPIIAGLISSIIVLPLISHMVLWLYHHHEEPDNIIGPIITTIGDIVNIGAILIAIIILT